MQPKPILLNACARAATAAEARFRIQVPIAPSRATRVVALDGGAVDIVTRVATMPWASARFLVSTVPQHDADETVARVDLHTVEGTPTDLADELDGVDVAIMVATSDAGADSAAVIGAACTVRGIMTAGLVLGRGEDSGAVAALRPHARFILVTDDEDDVPEVLTALRT
ncbi:MAG TPA: hypothetical protein VFL94_02025 [Actinomycetales bacterium]|nr:hypothetical protein [Actinomycetales bacterium]